jgi:AhpD family alkylhydroperoxidase
MLPARLLSSDSRGRTGSIAVFAIEDCPFEDQQGDTTMAAATAGNYGETVADIEATIGIVPGFMEALPEEDLVHEWPTFKKYVLGESEIPPKYRELVGLAVAANIKCPYCQAFHKGAAGLHGATDEELSEIAVLAGLTARWSSMIHAQHYDYDTFMEEFEQIGSFLQEGQAAD